MPLSLPRFPVESLYQWNAVFISLILSINTTTGSQRCWIIDRNCVVERSTIFSKQTKNNVTTFQQITQLLLQIFLLVLLPTSIAEGFSIKSTELYYNHYHCRHQYNSPCTSRSIDIDRSGTILNRPYTTRKMSTTEQQPDSAVSTTNGSNTTDTKLVISLRQYLSTNDDDNDETILSNTNKVSLILASQSPRRKEILDMMGLSNHYKVIVSPLNESSVAEQLLTTGSGTNNEDDTITNQVINPIDYTRILAEEKAMSLANHIAASTKRTSTFLVLGSDTIVVMDNTTILEKPKDVSDAISMLQTLSNRCHTVLTGVALVQVTISIPTNINEHQLQQHQQSVVHLVSSFTDTATVQFASLSYNDIVSYVNTGEPMDKSGSYGIQGIGGQLVQSINGDFFTVRKKQFRFLSLRVD
jgi:septum formation protein